MILESGGNTTKVNIKNIKVGFVLPIKNKDLGGNTSSTGTTNQGTKAKKLSVNGLVPFDDESDLKKLVKLAEAVTQDGERVIYTINDKTAELGDVRQVIFDGDLKIDEDGQFQAWRISFRLKQFNSVAEAKEQRKITPPSVTDTTSGQVIQAPSEEETAAVTQTTGWVFNALKKIDSLLGPANENNQAG